MCHYLFIFGSFSSNLYSQIILLLKKLFFLQTSDTAYGDIKPDRLPKLAVKILCHYYLKAEPLLMPLTLEISASHQKFPRAIISASYQSRMYNVLKVHGHGNGCELWMRSGQKCKSRLFHSYILHSGSIWQIFNTTKGSFTVELFPKHAPKTVLNFVSHRYSNLRWNDFSNKIWVFSMHAHCLWRKSNVNPKPTYVTYKGNIMYGNTTQ